MQNSPLRRPKRERVIETTWVLVLELDRPGGTAVQCLVNTEIGRVIPNRHQIRNVRTERLDIAEFQRLSSGHNTGVPSLPTISGDGECAAPTGCPDHLWIYRPDRDEAVGRPTVLWCYRRLMNQRYFLRAQSRAGASRCQQSYE